MSKEWHIDGFRFPGVPVPAPRMTRHSTWAHPEYHAYKAALANALLAQYPHLVIPDRPPRTPAKGYKPWALAYGTQRYEVSLLVCLSKDVGDLDNYAKTVLDAVAGVAKMMTNDKKVFRMELEKQMVAPGNECIYLGMRIVQ